MGASEADVDAAVRRGRPGAPARVAAAGVSPHRRTSGARTRRAAVALLALAACSGDAVGPITLLPLDAVPLAPRPVQYATWWRMTEACSGLTGGLGAVSWYVVPSGPFQVEGDTGPFDGYWFAAGNRVALTAGSASDGGMVRHEMLHALLRSGAHPREYFGVRCGALVRCDFECAVREADRGGVPGDARVVPAESLTVTVSLEPAGAPALSVDSGWVTIVVTATNARADPVWVELAGHATFGYELTTLSGAFDWSDEPRWAFRGGESRSVAFDRQLPAGLRDTLRAYFNDAYAPPRALTVGP